MSLFFFHFIAMKGGDFECTKCIFLLRKFHFTLINELDISPSKVFFYCVLVLHLR